MSSAGFASWEKAVEWLRTQPDKRDLVLASYYDDPAIHAAERYWRSAEWQALRAYLPAGSGLRVLDVGAGRGISSFAFAKDGYRVTALEPDPSQLIGAGAIRSLAAEATLSIEVVESASQRFPFSDATFDVVFARAVLHHMPDLGHACREFARVLKPGGRLVAIREHVISRAGDLAAFLDIHPLHHLYGGENAYLLDQYRRAIKDAEFRLQHVISPLDSDINLAPLDAKSVRAAIARHIGGRVPGGATVAHGILRVPGVWPVVRQMLRPFDRRPGRLYSFVALRR